MTKEELFDSVKKNSSYYQNIIETKKISGFSEIPALEKCEVKNIINNKFLKMPGYKKRVTSGTSGIPTIVCWKNDEYYRSILTLWRRRKKYYGISPQSRMVKFSHGLSNEDRQYYNYQNNYKYLVFDKNMVFSKVNLDEFFKIFRKFEPEWLYIQPAILRCIIWYLKNNDLQFPPSLKYIEVTGEIFDQSLKKLVKEHTTIPVANMYGSEEVNGIAFECPYGSMHIITDNVIVECQNNRDEILSEGKGEILITNRHNETTPLLRYKLGDIVNIANCPHCNCGSNEKVITRIEGRVRHLIKTEKGIISEYMLVEGIEKFCSEIPNILLKYQFTYFRASKALVLAICINPVFKSMEEKLKKLLKEYYNNLNVGISFTKVIVEEDIDLYETGQKAFLFRVVD